MIQALRLPGKAAILVALAATILAGGCARVRHPEAVAKPFSIIALPDTQVYSQNEPEVFYRQTAWIREQKDALNIAAVVHEGDITNRCTEAEWQVADKAMGTLDGVVPYCLVMGNHDIPGDGKSRDTALFNQYFGAERFRDKPWYGGHYGTGNENAYYRVRAAGMDFLIVCLEFGPRDEVLAWAGSIISRYRKDRAIIVTHSYMYSDDTRVGEGDRHNPHLYKTGKNDGEEMWEKLVRKHPNIFLVLSGHILNDGTGRLTSTGDHGNAVHQVLANYQMRKKGDNGWLRILRFVPSENRIEVSTYSPVLGRYLEDGENKFTLDYAMQ